MARKQSAVNMRLINLFPVTGLAQSPMGCVHAGENNVQVELANSSSSYSRAKDTVKNSF